MDETRASKRAHRADFEGPELGYHQNWYALAASADVPAGAVVGRDFLDGRVIVYRGEDGKVGVMSAYCSHLGADLSTGCVIKNDVRCPFHHWQYGRDGRCTKIPAFDRIPERARQLSLPTAERWGLIWAFNGPEPLFPVPGFRGYEDADLVVQTVEHPTLYPVAPWVLITNSHDLQHLKVLHGLKFPRGGLDNITINPYSMEHESLFETPDGMQFDQKLRITGTNTVSFTRKAAFGDSLNMWTGTRLPGGRTSGWIVTAVPKPRGDSPDERQAVKQTLGMVESLLVGIIVEDEPVMTRIRFREGILIPTDRELALYLQYVRSFPRANPLADDS